jgi:integrase
VLELATVQPEKVAQRESTLSQQRIVDYIWFMKKNGRAESTIIGRVRLIKRLAKLGADLYNPDDVKRVIAAQQWTAGRKDLACDAYTAFLAMTGGKWERPTYKPVDKEFFLPQPSEVKQLIAGLSPRMACFVQLLQETAMRPGEAWQLHWSDYDKLTRTIRVTPEKGSKSGTFRISKELGAMLDALPLIHGDRMFSKLGMPLDHHSRNFTKQRRRIANKLKNPRLMSISFKTMRHFRATMEAWRTKDPFYVQEFLRHRNIKNTMRYIHLAKTLFKGEQECVTKVAQNVNEACALIEDGWKYQTGEYADGGKIFAKPKDPLAEER